MSDSSESSDATDSHETEDSKESTESSESSDAFGEKVQDLRNRLKHLTQPLVDEALTARLAVIERAIADIDRALKELQGK